MQDLLQNAWINGTNLEVLSTTPLATPDVLSLTRGSVSTIQSQISATLSAFHKAHRAGFRLQDVSNAPLVRRRKRMREECRSSGSTDSSRSSTPVLPPTANFPSPLAVSTTTSPTMTVGAASVGSGTSGFQPLGDVLPPLGVIVSSVLDSTDWDTVLRSDSTISCGFNLDNSSPASHSPLLPPLSQQSSVSVDSSLPHRSTAVVSRAPIADGSSSSQGSRSPLSRAASFTSLGFSPATSAASSNDNSCHDSGCHDFDPSVATQIPSSSVTSSSSHNHPSTIGYCAADAVNRK